MKERLGYKIRKIREIKNISQDFIVKYLNMSHAAYSSIENGKTKIDESKLTRIATALGIKTGVNQWYEPQSKLWTRIAFRSKLWGIIPKEIKIDIALSVCASCICNYF